MLKKIAITGENGFLGYHLKNYFSQKYEIILLGRNYLNNLHLINGCDFLIHAAGVNRTTFPNDLFVKNITLTENLIKKLNELGIKINIKFISSIQEVNDNPYGESKKMSKQLLKTYCDESKTCFESYSLPNLFGTNGRPNYNSFVNTFTYNIINDKPSNINDNVIELCWVYDAINVIDNQTTEYKLEKTKVSEVYEILHNIHNSIVYEKTYLSEKLNEIYKFFKEKKMKILVLGHNGMLGSMVKKYLMLNNFEVITLEGRFPSSLYEKNILEFNGDFIINCVGAIPQKTKNFKINTDLPIWLSNNSQSKIIHAGTDCEIDSDDYGISKRLASEYINIYSDNTKILKTSIIGPEEDNNYGLLSWFLNQNGDVFGYTNAIWNGNTTLEWSKQCHTLMMNWNNYKTITILEGEPITKFDMLKLFNEVYEKNINIIPKDLGVDKTLIGDIKTKSLREQLNELLSF
jgi:nucleoside-diphosphate-sugar epimerase